jgi:prepilin-type N-terminal cleavage/methylation domain-containing protein
MSPSTCAREQIATDNGQRNADSGQGTKEEGQRTRRARARRGFTMIELLVVIIIVAILIGLLLPAINGAIRTAQNAAVSAEISQLSQALENFKNRYGDYPPSRVILYENGSFPVGNTVLIPGENITEGVLAQQSLAALRQFFPKVALVTSGLPAPVLAGQQNGIPYWYDFNGNGLFDQGRYILHGHECLVFFLGGIPLPDTAVTPPNYGMTGFGQDPTNPFTNSVNNGNNMYNGNRQPPIFEFNPGRLFLDPNNNTLSSANQVLPAAIPGYYDSLGNNPPGQGTTLNFYAYFSAYRNGNYNPDDVNFFTEDDGANNASQNQLAPVWLNFQRTGFSAIPNPYTSTQTANVPPGTLPSGTVTFQKAQTYQIISAGRDGQYGVGGQYIPATASTSTASNPLPFDKGNTGAGAGPPATPPAQAESGSAIRLREGDNLTNFKAGTLQ